MKFLHLNFLPRSTNLALLALRLWHGLAMLLLHGWAKFTGFSSMAEKFSNPLGIGHGPSLALAVFAEVVCSSLLVLGLFTRVAALVLMVDMGVAFWFVHGHGLSGQNSGELPFVFLGVFATLFLAGGGKLSVDAAIGAKT